MNVCSLIRRTNSNVLLSPDVLVAIFSKATTSFTINLMIYFLREALVAVRVVMVCLLPVLS